MDWVGLSAAVSMAERAEGPHGRRVVQVSHPDAGADVWRGLYSGATVITGPPSYRLSDGSIVNVFCNPPG